MEGLHLSLRTDLDQSLQLVGNLVGSVIPKGILRAKSAKPTLTTELDSTRQLTKNNLKKPVSTTNLSSFVKGHSVYFSKRDPCEGNRTS